MVSAEKELGNMDMVMAMAMGTGTGIQRTRKKKVGGKEFFGNNDFFS
jgi:hypothetical protein